MFAQRQREEIMRKSIIPPSDPNANVPADEWLIQGGITKNWFGLGSTTVFGEYSKSDGWGAGGGVLAPSGINYSASANLLGNLTVRTQSDPGKFPLRNHRQGFRYARRLKP